MDAIRKWVERIAAHAPPSARPAAFDAAISPDSTRFCWPAPIPQATPSLASTMALEFTWPQTLHANAASASSCRRLPIGDDGPVVGLGIETVILLDQETVGHLPDREGRCRIGHRHGQDAGVLSFADQLLDDTVLVAGARTTSACAASTMASTVARSTTRLVATMPPNADRGSHSNARRYAEARSAATAHHTDWRAS